MVSYPFPAKELSYTGSYQLLFGLRAQGYRLLPYGLKDTYRGRSYN